MACWGLCSAWLQVLHAACLKGCAGDLLPKLRRHLWICTERDSSANEHEQHIAFSK